MEILDKCCRRAFPFGAILDSMTVKGFKQNTFNTWSQGNPSEFYFRTKSSDVSRDDAEGTIRTRGKRKPTSFPRDHILVAFQYI